MKSTKFSFLVLIVCLFTVNLSVVNGQVREIFVSPIGCDTNEGTKSKPIKTLKRAQLLAKSSSLNDVVIYLQEGVHRINTPLTHFSSEWDMSSKT